MSDYDDLKRGDVCADTDSNPLELVEKELQDRTQGARANKLSNWEEKSLKIIMNKHKFIFKIRLGGRSSARVTPMKTDFDYSKNPVKVKMRRYTTGQRKSLRACFEKLVTWVS